MGPDKTLMAAIERLADYRISWYPEDEIDEDSKLTAADLDIVLKAARRAASMVTVRRLELTQLPEAIVADLARDAG